MTAGAKFVGLLAWVWTASAAPIAPVSSNEVHDWNVVSFDVTTAAGQNAVIASRATAMMHIAIHDALNAIDRRYEPYVLVAKADAQASPAAAIATAARDVLAALVPGFDKADKHAKATEVLQSCYEGALARIPDGPAREQGVAAGKAAAAAVLRLRLSDGVDRASSYKPRSAPGAWRPHPNPVPPNPPIENPELAPGNVPAVLPQWAELAPFAMTSPWQFRLPGPPALRSEAYARDFDEVRRLGAKNSTERTAEQSDVAKFWYDGSPHHWSRIARIVGAERKLDLWDSARLLALVNIAVADGYIAGADTRYHHDFWRPVTAIRAADADGNDATVPDPDWESFLNTPALPDYPSTHSVCGAAAATVLARFFGSDQVPFTMESGPPFPGMKRSYKGFSEACREIGESRIYAGVHFRSACRDGLAMGEQIGRWVFVHRLQPFREESARAAR
jgi:hypothetical protein